MKINVGKVLRVATKVMVAAPAVIAAAKPVVDALKRPAKTGTPTPRLSGTAPGTGRSMPDA